MSDLTYWLVRHADGERYLGTRAWVCRLAAFPFRKLKHAREDAEDARANGEECTVVRVTVRRVPRGHHAEVDRLRAALAAAEARASALGSTLYRVRTALRADFKSDEFDRLIEIRSALDAFDQGDING